MRRSAIVTWDSNIGIYLGSYTNRLEVTALLAYCKASGFSSPDVGTCGLASFVQVASNVTTNMMDVAIIDLHTTDIYALDVDYIIYYCKDWEIIQTAFTNEYKYVTDNYGLFRKTLRIINNSMPNQFKLHEDDLNKIIRDYCDIPF